MASRKTGRDPKQKARAVERERLAPAVQPIPGYAFSVIKRMETAVGVSGDDALAAALGISRSTIASWRTRNSIPFEECMRIALQRHVSLDWLILGRAGDTATPSEVAMEELSLAIVQGLVEGFSQGIEKLVRMDPAEVVARLR